MTQNSPARLNDSSVGVVRLGSCFIGNVTKLRFLLCGMERRGTWLPWSGHFKIITDGTTAWLSSAYRELVVVLRITVRRQSVIKHTGHANRLGINTYESGSSTDAKGSDTLLLSFACG